jgi:hypothetical protein
MHFRLPNLHAFWPFPRAFNPYCINASEASIKWFDSFGLISSPSRKERFWGIRTGVLSALCYPNHSERDLKITVDHNNLLFWTDDVTDEMSGKEAILLAKEIVECLR